MEIKVMNKPGQSIRAIARELGVSRQTVRRHLSLSQSPAWLGLPRGLGGASSLTTIPSAFANATGGGRAGSTGGALRTVGRVVSPVWITYGVYLFGMEAYCLSAYAQNNCVH